MAATVTTATPMTATVPTAAAMTAAMAGRDAEAVAG
jgi:hypothetical protein